MMYTEEVRKKLDMILKAFEGYIDDQDYFDIVCSKKIGYVMILAQNPGEAGAEALDARNEPWMPKMRPWRLARRSRRRST